MALALEVEALRNRNAPEKPAALQPQPENQHSSSDLGQLEMALKQLQDMDIPQIMPSPALIQMQPSASELISSLSDRVENARDDLGAGKTPADILPMWALPRAFYMRPEVTFSTQKICHMMLQFACAC